MYVYILIFSNITLFSIVVIIIYLLQSQETQYYIFNFCLINKKKYVSK